jgi:predicted DCC family thiol-disulfide oxidoreductase YuxK
LCVYSDMKSHPILLFDGVCKLCSGTVLFVVERDPNALFRFSPLQSELGQTLLRQYNLPTDTIQSAVLIVDGKAYTESDAALYMAKYLGGIWQYLYILRYIPKAWRDVLYRWVAQRRYHWFGQHKQCMMPSPELKARFLA